MIAGTTPAKLCIFKIVKGMKNRKLTRRDFLRLSSISIIGLAAKPIIRLPPPEPTPQGGGGLLGRITSPSLKIMSRPGPHGEHIGTLFHDEIVPVKQYVVGEGWYPHNHIWAETDAGYMYSSFIQPVENALNEPLNPVPEGGFYGDVSVPFVQTYLGPGTEFDESYLCYYASVFHIDRGEQASDGTYWYHINDENGKVLWVPAEAIRYIPEEDLAPISPDVEDKHIAVDLSRQWLLAYENGTEVYRTRISSGLSFFGDNTGERPRNTPIGTMPIWSKRISRHMAGGTPTNGWDLPGVGFVSYFASNGAAIHATFWHNDYGRPRSAGCLNCPPAAARWLFRWTTPLVDYLPGNIIVEWPGGTKVNIYESGVA